MIVQDEIVACCDLELGVADLRKRGEAVLRPCPEVVAHFDSAVAEEGGTTMFWKMLGRFP